jgi:hypothetical protein
MGASMSWPQDAYRAFWFVSMWHSCRSRMTAWSRELPVSYRVRSAPPKLKKELSMKCIRESVPALLVWMAIYG